MGDPQINHPVIANDTAGSNPNHPPASSDIQSQAINNQSNNANDENSNQVHLDPATGQPENYSRDSKGNISQVAPEPSSTSPETLQQNNVSQQKENTQAHDAHTQNLPLQSDQASAVAIETAATAPAEVITSNDDNHPESTQQNQTAILTTNTSGAAPGAPIQDSTKQMEQLQNQQHSLPPPLEQQGQQTQHQSTGLPPQEKDSASIQQYYPHHSPLQSNTPANINQQAHQIPIPQQHKTTTTDSRAPTTMVPMKDPQQSIPPVSDLPDTASIQTSNPTTENPNQASLPSYAPPMQTIMKQSEDELTNQKISNKPKDASPMNVDAIRTSSVPPASFSASTSVPNTGAINAPGVSAPSVESVEKDSVQPKLANLSSTQNPDAPKQQFVQNPSKFPISNINDRQKTLAEAISHSNFDSRGKSQQPQQSQPVQLVQPGQPVQQHRPFPSQQPPPHKSQMQQQSQPRAPQQLGPPHTLPQQNLQPMSNQPPRIQTPTIQQSQSVIQSHPSQPPPPQIQQHLPQHQHAENKGPPTPSQTPAKDAHGPHGGSHDPHLAKPPQSKGPGQADMGYSDYRKSAPKQTYPSKIGLDASKLTKKHEEREGDKAKPYVPPKPPYHPQEPDHNPAMDRHHGNVARYLGDQHHPIPGPPGDQKHDQPMRVPPPKPGNVSGPIPTSTAQTSARPGMTPKSHYPGASPQEYGSMVPGSNVPPANAPGGSMVRRVEKSPAPKRSKPSGKTGYNSNNTSLPNNSMTGTDTTNRYYNASGAAKVANPLGMSDKGHNAISSTPVARPPVNQRDPKLEEQTHPPTVPGAPMTSGAVPPGPGAGGAPQASGNWGNSPSYRQLKVEDALSYLEEVKLQFSDKPQVYNNFLDIMKEFKSQGIDTTEVIERVSKLFRGHRNLILGFNTFLPPGYKIEVRDDPVTGQTNTGFSGPGGYASLPMASTPGRNNVPMGKQNPQSTMPSKSIPRNDEMPPNYEMGQSNAYRYHMQPGMPQQQMSSQAAPIYRSDMYERPDKDDTGYPPVVSGPPSVAGGPGGMASGVGGPLPPSTASGPPGTAVGAVTAGAAGGGIRKNKTGTGTSAPSAGNAPQNKSTPSVVTGGHGKPSQNGSATGGQRPVEFDQAISYVNKIKLRFLNQESVYKQFLDILHTYQKEQKSIKEVYEQVAFLFKDHRDLLDEFTHFLPDSADQHKTATEANANKVVKRPAIPTGNVRPVAKSVPPTTGAVWSKTKKEENIPGIATTPTPVVSGGTLTSAQKKNKKRKLGVSVEGKDSNANANSVLSNQLSPSIKHELNFFEQLREKLGPTRGHLYSEFIKCLSLFSQEIISKSELTMLAEELFGKNNSLFRGFRAFLDGASSGKFAIDTAIDVLKADAINEQNIDDGAIQFITSSGASSSLNNASYEKLQGDSFGDSNNQSGAKNIQSKILMWKSRPISEIAAESRIKMTDSYKKLPPDFPIPVCSGKSDLERKTLNDYWVSVPTGSEEFSNKHFKRNPYEDNLFRCEDDRYELDMVIETNAATIQRLEPIAATISKLSADDKKRHALAEGALGAVHFRAIERIYGDHGSEVVEQIKFNPSVAVPVTLARLKQKDQQWRRARLEMNKIWREVCEKNYLKSLDHRSFYFKQADKKELSSRLLVQDICDISSAKAGDSSNIDSLRALLEQPSSHIEKRLLVPAAKENCEFFGQSLIVVIPAKGIFSSVCNILESSVAYEGGTEESKTICSRFKKFFEIFWEISAEETIRRKKANVVYGDEQVYLLMRYVNILHTRLRHAYTLALEQASTYEEREHSKAFSTNTKPPLQNAPSSLTKSSFVSEIEKENQQSKVLSADPSVIFDAYITNLQEFLSGLIDANRYEDKCRIILGARSYYLFTMDKVVSKFVKQVNQIMSPNNNQLSNSFMKLFWEREKKRSEGEGEYVKEAIELSQRGSFVRSLYRFEFVERSIKHCDALGIENEALKDKEGGTDRDKARGMVDGNTLIMSFAPESVMRNLTAETMASGWKSRKLELVPGLESLYGFQSSSTDNFEKLLRSYFPKNKIRVGGSLSKDSIELHIDRVSGRVMFVAGMEDVFVSSSYHPRKPNGTNHKSSRDPKKFQLWLNKHLGEDMTTQLPNESSPPRKDKTDDGADTTDGAKKEMGIVSRTGSETNDTTRKAIESKPSVAVVAERDVNVSRKDDGEIHDKKHEIGTLIEDKMEVDKDAVAVMSSIENRSKDEKVHDESVPMEISKSKES